MKACMKTAPIESASCLMKVWKSHLLKACTIVEPTKSSTCSFSILTSQLSVAQGGVLDGKWRHVGVTHSVRQKHCIKVRAGCKYSSFSCNHPTLTRCHCFHHFLTDTDGAVGIGRVFYGHHVCALIQSQSRWVCHLGTLCRDNSDLHWTAWHTAIPWWQSHQMIHSMALNFHTFPICQRV